MIKEEYVHRGRDVGSSKERRALVIDGREEIVGGNGNWKLTSHLESVVSLEGVLVF